MNTENTGGEAHPESLDADAVCAQCNTVNAEGTLLCKSCGNNLRDQRTLRLAADQEMDLERTGRHRNWMSGLLFVMAIGLIIATLVNQDRIVQWLISPPGTSGAALAGLWQGENNDIFNPLLDELMAANVDEEAARLALESTASSGALGGVYALFANDEFAGSANVVVQEDDLYFVALLESGEEVRGRAVPQGNYYAAQPEFAGYRNRRGIGGGQGVAMPQGNGYVECIVDIDRSDGPVSFIAIQMPDA